MGWQIQRPKQRTFQTLQRFPAGGFPFTGAGYPGSVAWAEAITQAGVLTQEECQTLTQALAELLAEVKDTPEQIIASGAEDIHSFVESQLIAKVGDLGKKLHTGRSRNDQVATDLKLWCKQEGAHLLSLLIEVKQGLLALAERELDAVMPGYTHLQRAQPVTFGHWALAYVEMFERDISRLQDALNRLNTSSGLWRLGGYSLCHRPSGAGGQPGLCLCYPQQPGQRV